MQERRPEAAALLISYGASFNIRNRNNDSLLQYELRSKNRDLTILFAIAKSVAYLPTIESLSIFPPHSQLISTDYSANRHMVKLIKNDVQYYKIMWYKELTRDPRSLQHYCRCVVRKAMGVRRLGQIDTLPLPSTLKDYLHLRMEEFSVSIPEMPDTWPPIPQFPLSHVVPKTYTQSDTVLSTKGCFSFRTSFDSFCLGVSFEW